MGRVDARGRGWRPHDRLQALGVDDRRAGHLVARAREHGARDGLGDAEPPGEIGGGEVGEGWGVDEGGSRLGRDGGGVGRELRLESLDAVLDEIVRLRVERAEDLRGRVPVLEELLRVREAFALEVLRRADGEAGVEGVAGLGREDVLRLRDLGEGLGGSAVR